MGGLKKIDAEKTHHGRPPIPFYVWKLRLQEDCEHRGKLRALSAITDKVLQLFWARGVAPSAEAIINNGAALLNSLHSK